MRRWFLTRPPALRWLLAANVLVYIALLLLGLAGAAVSGSVAGALALDPALPALLARPWQLLTYGVVHLAGRGLLFGLLHLGFNLAWLVWIGEELEQLYGTRRFAGLYAAGTVVGGLLTVALHALAPSAPAFAGPVYGATAPVIAIVAASVVLFPYKRIGLLFIGVISLRTALIAFLVLSVLFGLGGGTFFAAHIGGALAGVAMGRAFQGGSRRSRSRTARKGEGDGGEREAGVLDQLERWLAGRGRRSEPEARPRPDRTESAGPGEVDRILDKISERGYESLTDAEKRTLYEASKH